MRIAPLHPLANVASTVAEMSTPPAVSTLPQEHYLSSSEQPLRARPRRRALSAPPLVPLSDSQMTGKPALVALDSEFSEQRLAEVQARQITVQALQSKLAAHLADAGAALPSDSIAARFAAGTLQPVYVETATFNDIKRSLPGRARAAVGPVLVDAQQGRIIFDLQSAFAPGDTFSDAAVTALGSALNIFSHGLNNPDWLVPASKSRTAHRKPLQTPQYRGHHISKQEGRAWFYKPDDHRLLEGKDKQMREHLKKLVHANYLQSKSTRAVGKDVMVHRGLYDFHHGIPENSLSAIDNAYAHGYRTLELDVETSAEGIPMLFHDFTVGRTLGLPDNQLIAKMPFSELRDQHLVIRNPVDGNFIKTNQRLSSIEQMLDYVMRTKPGISIVLDCKENTAEDIALMLLSRPHFLPFTAVKVYSSAYKGGFDQMFSNLCKRLQINPLHSQDEPRRRKLRNELNKIKVVPILAEHDIQDPQMRGVFPGDDSASGLAETVTRWMQSWNGMHPVIAEAMVAHPDSNAGKAMKEARARLRQPGSGYEEAAFSAAYRFEDFSVAKSDGGRQYFTWGMFGEINPVTEDGFEPKRGTAGAFRDQGESVLTDEPNEEVLALREDRTLPRGHTGVELNAPPGTTIDTKRDASLVNLRRQEFAARQRTLDKQSVDAVREGARLDHGAAAQLTQEARAVIDTHAESLGMLTERYRGAPVSHYLNEQAKGCQA
nr:type III secretion system effector avirulence protein AvrBs2 [Xanthomonas axonopodis]